MKFSINIILSIISLACCTSGYEKSNVYEQDSIIDLIIDINEIGTCNDWKTIVKNIELIPLQSCNKAIVGDIVRLLVNKNRYIILTRNDGVYFYHRDGSFINHIALEGKGPFELLNPMDISISNYEIVSVLDQHKILLLDTNGIALEEIPISINYTEQGRPINCFYHNTDTVFTWHSAIYTNRENRYHLYVSDNSGIPKINTIAYSHFSFGVEGRFSQGGNREIAVAPRSLYDTIFVIKEGSIAPRFVINVKQNKYPNEKLVGINNDTYQYPYQFFEYQRKNNLYTSVSNIVFNDRYISFYLMGIAGNYQVVYNYINHKYSIFQCYPRYENLIFFPSRLVGSFENYFFSYINAFEVVDYFEEQNQHDQFFTELKIQKLLSTLKNIDENDNPVIMIIELKPLE